MREDVKVKGTALFSTIDYIIKKYGNNNYEALISKIPQELYQEIRVGVISSQWYPLELLIALMRAAGELFGKQNFRLYHEMGQHSAEYGLKSIYKIFLKFGSPEFIIKKAPLVWKNYYNRGEMKIIDSSRNRVTMRLYNFPTPDKIFCQRITGWAEKTAELSGGKNSLFWESKCILEGGEYCEWKGKWEI